MLKEHLSFIINILWYFLYSHKESDSHFEISIKEAHKKGMEEKRDSLSDNEAIEAYDDFTYYLDVEDNEAEAIRIISPYLKKENRYGSVPHQSYYYLARYYFDKGQIGKSIKFAKTSLVMIEKDYPDYSCFTTICSILFDIISIRYKEKAFRTFKKLLNCLEMSGSQNIIRSFMITMQKLMKETIHRRK